jgi:hypothetical protein
MFRLYRVFRDILTWLFGGVLIALVGEFAISLAREHGFFEHPTERVEAIMGFLSAVQDQFWFRPAITSLAGLVIGMWLDSFVRRRIASAAIAIQPPVNSGARQIDEYVDDPEAEATDKQAYKEILAFALDQIIPACDAQVDLQKKIISQASDNPVIGAIACMGLEHSARTTEFWYHYRELAAGLLASPGPIIRFETIIEHIAGLENGAYRTFSEQMNEFAVIFSKNVTTDSNLRPAWLKWVEAHNTLVEAYGPIKRDPRFGKLLRPARHSRWGERIQIDSLAREHGPAAPTEQTIDICFEPQPPYETNEISNGRGLSTVRIGLKAFGKTFSNCQIFIEKIAPQPPLPGGMPILLADSVPMLRPDDPEAFVMIAQHWDHVDKYRFSAPTPPIDVRLTYIDDQPPRLIEIKIKARNDAGDFIKTATFKILVDDAKKIHLQRQ